MIGARDVGGEGKVVFSQTGSVYRVKADLQTSDGRLALAFRRVVEAFTASVERLEGVVKK